MPRLLRELIFARHLSFEAWPDVGQERPTTSNYIFGAVCPKEGHGAALILAAYNAKAINICISLRSPRPSP